MSIFSRVWDSKAQDPFNWALFKCYKFMKGRTGSTLSRTKYIKCFIVETSCYRLVLWLNFIVTVELLYDQVESDFVQCQTTMQAFASRIEPDWNRIVHQNGSWILVFSTTRPWNKQISAPDASQPSSQERWQVADLKHLKTSDIFSLPRISTKDFPYIKGKIDWSIGINYSSVNFNRPKFFLLPVVWSQRSMNFLKIQVIQAKSKPRRVAMIWLRVKMNRTRLCTAALFGRNEIKYEKSRESGLFQYILNACKIAGLFVIYTVL